MFPLLGNGPNAMVIAGKTSSKQPIEKLFEITSRGSLYTEPSSMSAPQVDVKAQMQLSRRESQHIGFDTHPISSGTNSDFKSVASFSRKMSAEGHAMHNQHHDLLMGASLGDNDSGAETSDYDALDPDPFPSPTSLGTTSADGKRSLSKCSKESPDNGTDLDSCGVKLTVGTSTQATASIANQTLIASPRTAVISRSCSPSNNINQIATASSPSYSFALQSSADLRLASATNFTNSSSRPPGSVSPYLSPPQSPSSESSVGDPRNNHLFQQQHRKRRSSTSTDLAEEGALEDDSKSARDLDDDMDYLAFQTGVVDPSLTGMSAAHYGISAPGSGTTTILDANGMPVGIAVSAGAMDCRNAPGHGQGQGQTVDPEESCPVCGDKVSGYHYGLMTCESCKGFFKRTVQNNKVYQCIENKECRIDKSQRKRCPYCRFQKCLTVGMKLEAVRADRMRGGRNKFGPMYKRDRAIKQQQKAIRAQMIQVAMHGSMHAATSIQIAALAGGAKQNAQNSAGSHLDATQVVLPCPPLAPGSQHTLYCAPVSSGMGIDPSGSLDQLCIKSEPSQSSLPPSVVSCVISTNHNMAGVYANSANYSSHNSSQSGATLMSPTEYQHYITSQQQENHLFSSSPSFPAMIYTGSINNNSLSINNPLKATAASFASNAFHSNAPDIFHHNAAMSYMNGGGTDLTSCKANETPSPPMKQQQQQQQQNEDYATSMLSGRMPQQQTQLAGLNNNPPKLLLELSTSEPLTETMRARVMSSFHFYMDTPTATPFSLFVKGLEQLLFCFVDWARSSCFFKDLQVEDQMKLLQSSWSNLVLFDHIYRQLKYSSAHSSAPRIVLITGHVLDVRILQLNGLHEAADKFIGLANFLRSVKLDFYEYVAIKFLLLLNPEVSSLSDKMYIERSQQHINSCLMDYCLQTQPQQPDRFQFLILQLKQLSALATCFEEYLLLRQSSGEVPANSLISEMLHASRKRTSAAHTTTTTLSNNTPTGDASPSNTTSTTCSSSNSNSIVIGTERCAADIFSEASHLASSADASSLGTINGTPLAPCTPSVLRSAATTTPQNGGIV